VIIADPRDSVVIGEAEIAVLALSFFAVVKGDI